MPRRPRARDDRSHWLRRSLVQRVAAVPEKQRAVLDERLADHEANPADVVTWAELKRQLRYR